MIDHQPIRYERRKAAAVLVSWTVLYGVAALFPSARLWGVNFLAFTDPIFRWYVLAAAAVALAGVILVRGRAPLAFPRRASLKNVLQSWWGGVFLTVLAVGGGWLLRTRAPLLGDGIMRAADAVKMEPPMPSEFLPTFLAGLLARHPPASWGLDGTAALQILSVFSLAGLIIGLWSLLPRTNKTGSRSALFWFLTFGSVRLFAGYVETYPLAVTAIALWTAAAVAYRRGHLSALPVIAFWTLAFLSHATALLLAPATLWLLWRGSGNERASNNTAMAIFAVLALGLGSWTVYRIELLQLGNVGLSAGHYLLPLLGSAPHHYGILSPPHILDFINECLLLAPAFLLAAPLLQRRTRCAGRPGRVGSPRNDPVFWWLAAGLPLAAGLVFDPKLGWARDWDLFTLFFAPALMGTALWLGTQPPSLTRRAAAMVAVLSAGIWLAFSVNADWEVNRYKALLELDRSRADYGHEILALYYRNTGRPLGEIAQYKEALEITENLRYRANIARAYLALDRENDAITWYRTILDRDSTFDIALDGMAVALQRSGRFDAALPYAQRALTYRPQDPGRLYMVGYLAMNTGDFAAAQPYLEAAARAVPDNPVYLNSLGRCDFKLDRIPEARTAWHQAMRVAPRFAPAYLNCARMEWHVGNRDEARRLLTGYERLVPPARRAPAAAVLIDSLVREGNIRPQSQ